MSLRSVFITALLLGFKIQAGMVEVDGFAAYTSSAQLRSAWSIVAGSPELNLVTNENFAGSRGLLLNYATSADALTNAVRLTFSKNQDWSSYNALEFSYGGAGQEAHSTNSNDTVIIQLLGEHGDVLGSFLIPGGTKRSPITEATMDLSDKNAFKNTADENGLRAVRSIVLGIVSSRTNHSGAVYFGDIFVGDNGNLARNPGFQGLNQDGQFGDDWTAHGAVNFQKSRAHGNPGCIRFRSKAKAGEVRGASVSAASANKYRFSIDAAFTSHWNGIAEFGVEFLAADNTTVLSCQLQRVYAPNPAITAYRTYSMTAQAPAKTAFIRPVICCTNSARSAKPQSAFFDNAMLKVETNEVISILGSSVANGWKAAGFYNNFFVNGSVADSYGGHLTEALAPDGWRVVSQSIPGDTTPKVIRRFNRDEVPVGADVALIGLSLGNEGLSGAKNPEAICRQYYSGITNIIAMAWSNNILSVVGSNYPKDTYNADEYARLKQVDLEINALNVPSVNFLGATDDGKGHWVHNDFINLGAGDTIHPNSAGHYEMFLAIVPSLFDALKAGKPMPSWGDRTRCLQIRGDASRPAPLSFTPDSTMHSFTMSFCIRTKSIGTVASVTLPEGEGCCTVETTSSGLAYVGSDGEMHKAGVACSDGKWHAIVIAHQYARGETMVYVDGNLTATVAERLTPVGFILGGPGRATQRPESPALADYQDWFVHRSMLVPEEVAAQFHGALQQSSLELYAPLDDADFSQGATVTNRAQSLSLAFINGPTSNYSAVSAKSDK